MESEEALSPIVQKNDRYTYKYEIAKRQGEALDEKLRLKWQQYLKEKKEAQSILEWNEEEPRELRRLEGLENKLKLLNSQISKIRNENESKREQINVKKRTNIYTKRAREGFFSEIGKVDKEIRSRAETITSLERSVESTKHKIVNAIKFHTVEKSQIDAKTSKLEETLEKEAKSLTPIKHKRERTPPTAIFKYLDTLKKLGNKWAQSVKEKTHEFKQFKAYIEGLYVAFRAIGGSVGTDTLDDIVRVILVNYDQETKLRSNLLRLNEKAEKIQRQIEKVQMQKEALAKSSEDAREKQMAFLALKNSELDDYLKKEEAVANKQNKMEREVLGNINIVFNLIQTLKEFGVETRDHGNSDYILTMSNAVKQFSVLQEMVMLFKAGIKNTPVQNIAAQLNKSPTSCFITADNRVMDLEKAVNEQDDFYYPLSANEMRERAQKILFNLENI